MNTSGFSLDVIQPISPTFAVAAGQSGISKELLLRLFVEFVEFTKHGQRHRVSNNPYCGVATTAQDTVECGIIAGDDKTFLKLVENPLLADVDLRLVTF